MNNQQNPAKQVNKQKVQGKPDFKLIYEINGFILSQILNQNNNMLYGKRKAS